MVDTELHKRNVTMGDKANITPIRGYLPPEFPAG
jgi:hypothetical protein